MPSLDLASLGLLTLCNFIAMALVLPLAMGAHISPAARHVQRYFMMQAATWTGMLLLSRQRGTAWEPMIAMGTTVVIVLGQMTMARALALWLGPRPGQRWLLACSLAGPLGFALLWPYPLLRFVWFSTAQGLGLMILARMCLTPRKECAANWRWVLLGCALTVALALWARAVLAWLGPAPLNYTSADSVNHAFIILCNLCCTLMLVAVLVAWRDETNQQLRELAQTDPLTGLPNRRGFEERARAMLSHARRNTLPLTVLMMDLDHFKQVNDIHGHEAGDQTLQLFSQLLRQNGRGSDLAARLGGEEFCLLLHGDAAVGHSLDQRLRRALRAATPSVLGRALDYSAGLAELHPGDSDISGLLARADAALYAAKAGGRGQLQRAAPAISEALALSA